MNSIRALLKELNLIDEDNLELFSSKTRDKDNIKVYKDSVSGLVFIDEFVTNDSDYVSGDYRTHGATIYGKRDYEITVDVRRRVNDYEQFFIGKRIIDFGCGEGSFIDAVKPFAEYLCGIELEEKYLKDVNARGIACFKDLDSITETAFDTIFCFHTLEHLHTPIEFLKSFKNFLKPEGKLVIEVPHANDFLLKTMADEHFKNFTLWSQHLILHTRHSLERFLSASGYNKFIIQGKQRYSVANHLNWLALGKPGGHKALISALDTDELKKSYERSLQMIDATDTLVVIAENS